MGSMNVKVAELNKGPIALQKDLEFIGGVAKKPQTLEPISRPDSSSADRMGVC
jgi:hypothetical protein